MIVQSMELDRLDCVGDCQDVALESLQNDTLGFQTGCRERGAAGRVKDGGILAWLNEAELDTI